MPLPAAVRKLGREGLRSNSGFSLANKPNTKRKYSEKIKERNEKVTNKEATGKSGNCKKIEEGSIKCKGKKLYLLRPVVLISKECREKAEAAAMKLRKSMGVIQNASDSDTDEDTSSSSDDEGNGFDSDKRCKRKDSRRTPTRAESASDSSSESLLDIPPPSGFHHRLPSSSSSQSKDKPPILVKASKSTDVEEKSRSSSRSLRSSFSDINQSSNRELFPKVRSTTSAISYCKNPKVSCGNKNQSPEREKSNTDKHQSKSNETEKTYPLRHLERKRTLSNTNIETKVAIEVPTQHIEPIIPKKPGRGRPRKDAQRPIKLPAAKEIDSSPPPAKRTRRLTSMEGGIVSKNSPFSTSVNNSQPAVSKSTENISEVAVVRKKGRPRNPLKHQRDAIALRARQSKIMAKSRVLQSNKYSLKATWRKQIPATKNSSSGSNSSHSVGSSSSSDDEASRSSTSSATADDEEIISSTLDPLRSRASHSEKQKSEPMARCEVCNLTFTRKFSFTKHLRTIQHQKMLRRASKTKANDCKQLKQRLKYSADKFNEDDNPTHEYDQQKELEIDEENSKDVHHPPWISGRYLGNDKFVCNVCGDIFIKRLDFTAHLWNHREDSDLICQKCGEKFTQAEEFNEHIDSAHSPKEFSFQCQHCPSKFSKEDHYEKHVKSHKFDFNGKFLCPSCDKRFDSYELQSHHFDYKHLKLGKPEFDVYKRHANSILKAKKNVADEECDNYFENYDPGQDSDMPDLELEEANRRSHSTSNYNSENHKIIRRYLHRSWLKDNSIIGCGTTGDGDVHGPYNPLCCKDCGQVFDKRRHLVQHVEHSRYNRTVHTCLVCKASFKWRYLLNRHMMRHRRGKEQQKLKIFKASKLKPRFLKNHLKPLSGIKHLPKLLPIMKSPDSGSQFPSSVVNLESSSNFETSPTVVLVQGNFKKNSKGNNSFACVTDPLMSPDFNATETNSNTPSTTTLRNTTFEPNATEDGSFFKCNQCTRAFTEEKTLAAHGWCHDSGTLISCTECEARCERKSDFDLHKKCHEKNQPFFLCYVCFKPFRWKKDMIRHVRKKHPDERTYRCVYCNERLRTNEQLADHITKSHAAHRSFPCEYCEKRYAQKRYLLLHVRSVHTVESGEGIPESFELVDAEEESDEIYLDASHFVIAEHSD